MRTGYARRARQALITGVHAPGKSLLQKKVKALDIRFSPQISATTYSRSEPSIKKSDRIAGHEPKKDRICSFVMSWLQPSLKWCAMEGQYVCTSLTHCALNEKQSL
mmetsp:Transcript_36124/g.73495  ORF Transcript_36124/g.73495 Transcript_36124/m.73495 type:complete len:106 (+) Transcript_36124:192-509(+)